MRPPPTACKLSTTDNELDGVNPSTESDQVHLELHASELCNGLMNRYVPTEAGAFGVTRDSRRRECCRWSGPI